MSALMVASAIPVVWGTMLPAQAELAAPVRGTEIPKADGASGDKSAPRPPLPAPPPLPSATPPPSAAPWPRSAPPLPAMTNTHEDLEPMPDWEDANEVTPTQTPKFPEAGRGTPESTSIHPAIEIRHEAPRTMTQRGPIPVRIAVINHGAVAVDRVIVTNDLGAEADLIHATPKPERNANVLIWALGELGAGQERVIELTVVVKPTAKTKSWKNSATVSYQATSSRETLLQSPRIQLAVEGPSKATVGEAILFTMDITNTGDATATNVILKDPLPAGLVHPHGPELENEIGDLAPGETRRIRLSLVANQAGTVVNRVHVVCDGLEPVDGEASIEVDEIQLTLECQGPKVRYLNRPCTHELHVENSGSTDAKEVRVSAKLPAGVEFVHASDGGVHDGIANTVTWNLGEVKAKESKVLALTGVASEIGEKVFQASLTAPGSMPREMEWSTSIQGIAALQVDVVDVDDPIEVGTEGIYEIRVMNQGTMAATNVRVEASIPAELEAVAADGPTPQRLVDRVLTFDPIEKLAPKADVTFRVKVKGARAGDCRFKTTVTTDQLTRPVVKEESTTVYGDE